MTEPLHTTLHRTAKYFMDSGRAQTAEEAMDLLKSYGLTIAVGPEIHTSPAAQIALLTLVNLGRRTFLGGVEVVGLESAPFSRLPRTGADARRRSIGARRTPGSGPPTGLAYRRDWLGRESRHWSPGVAHHLARLACRRSSAT